MLHFWIYKKKIDDVFLAVGETKKNPPYTLAFFLFVWIRFEPMTINQKSCEKSYKLEK